MNERESAYQMKMRNVTFSIFLTLAGLCHAEVTGPLSTLRNEWGKGSIVDFRKVAYENLPLLFDEGGTAAVEGWCNELVDYPDFGRRRKQYIGWKQKHLHCRFAFLCNFWVLRQTAGLQLRTC